MTLPSPAWSRSGSPVKTCLTAAGSAVRRAPIGLGPQREVVAAALPAAVEEPRRPEHEAGPHHEPGEVRPRRAGGSRRWACAWGPRAGECLLPSLSDYALRSSVDRRADRVHLQVDRAVELVRVVEELGRSTRRRCSSGGWRRGPSDAAGRSAWHSCLMAPPPIARLPVGHSTTCEALTPRPPPLFGAKTSGNTSRTISYPLVPSAPAGPTGPAGPWAPFGPFLPRGELPLDLAGDRLPRLVRALDLDPRHLGRVVAGCNRAGGHESADGEQADRRQECATQELRSCGHDETSRWRGGCCGRLSTLRSLGLRANIRSVCEPPLCTPTSTPTSHRSSSATSPGCSASPSSSGPASSWRQATRRARLRRPQRDAAAPRPGGSVRRRSSFRPASAPTSRRAVPSSTSFAKQRRGSRVARWRRPSSTSAGWSGSRGPRPRSQRDCAAGSVTSSACRSASASPGRGSSRRWRVARPSRTACSPSRRTASASSSSRCRSSGSGASARRRPHGCTARGSRRSATSPCDRSNRWSPTSGTRPAAGSTPSPTSATRRRGAAGAVGAPSAPRARSGGEGARGASSTTSSAGSSRG